MIRLATPRDIPQLTDLLQVLFEQEADFTPDPEAQEAGLRLFLDDPFAGDILVAEQDGQIVGTITLALVPSTAEGSTVGNIEDFVVDPVHRGQGVGKALMEQAILYAQELGIRRLTLLTDVDNHHAQSVYSKFGFRKSCMVPMRKYL